MWDRVSLAPTNFASREERQSSPLRVKQHIEATIKAPTIVASQRESPFDSGLKLMETIYKHNGASLLSDGEHYYTKSKEDYKVISEHLDYTMRHTSKLSQEYKDAKRLFCDLFIKKCYLLESNNQ